MSTHPLSRHEKLELVWAVIVLLVALVVGVALLLQNWDTFFPPCYNPDGCLGPGA